MFHRQQNTAVALEIRCATSSILKGLHEGRMVRHKRVALAAQCWALTCVRMMTLYYVGIRAPQLGV